MFQGPNLALLIRGFVAIILACGGIICLILGFRLLFRRKGSQATSTTFDAMLGSHKVSFSTGTAGTAVVLTSAVWAVCSLFALPSFTMSPDRTTVASFSPGKPVATLAFAGDNVDLTRQQQAALDSVAPLLKHSTGSQSFVIESYAEMGSEKYSQALAERRAAVVRDYLVQKHGVPPEKLQVLGFGEEKPKKVPGLRPNIVAILPVGKGGDT